MEVGFVSPARLLLVLLATCLLLLVGWRAGEQQSRRNAAARQPFRRQPQQAGEEEEEPLVAEAEEFFEYFDVKERLPPVVMVPGIAGSGLFAKFVNADIPQCGSKAMNTSWFRIWASLSQMRPPESHQFCWASSMALLAPNCTREAREHLEDFQDDPRGCPLEKEGPEALYRSKEGVYIRPDRFGVTEGFEYLDYVYSYGVYGAEYFASLVKAFRDAGYEDNETLYGFPYDWRYPPEQLDFHLLRILIELASRRSGGKKVTLISHSLGSVVLTQFLNVHVSAGWKEKHVAKFISMNGAFGGSPKAVRSLLTGYADPLTFSILGLTNMTLVPPEVIRYFHQRSGSMYALAPNPEVYGSNVPLVTIRKSMKKSSKVDDVETKERVKAEEHEEGSGARDVVGQYTVGNWTLLLPPRMRALARRGIAKMPVMLRDPQVPVYCLHSRFDHAQTEYQYVYNDGLDFNQEPDIGRTFGDGTLPLQSLSWCNRWNSTVFSAQLRGLDHMALIKDAQFAKLVLNLTVLETPPSTEAFVISETRGNTTTGGEAERQTSWPSYIFPFIG